MNPTIVSDAHLLEQIELFCRQQDMGVTTFGRAAVGDPNLVANMRKGRSLTLRTAESVVKYIVETSAAAATDASSTPTPADEQEAA